jgi:uncharacterized protein YggE
MVAHKGPLALALAALVFALALTSLAGCTKVITTPAGSAANTVTATGSGTAPGNPDEADMSFGVTRHAADSKTALANASTVAQSITSALAKGGVDKKDIQTQNVSVNPQFVDQNGKQVVNGFDASIAVSVKVRDLSKLGELITAANAAGADNINGPTFTLSDPAPTRAQAITLAVADARKTAQAMAKAAGKSVGGVLSISTNDVASQPVPLFSTASAGAAKSVPIEPGQLDVTANVTVVFELK